MKSFSPLHAMERGRGVRIEFARLMGDEGTALVSSALY